MYPLNMTLIGGIGYALANSKDEHKALTDIGYEPKFVESELEVDEAGHTPESVRALLDAAGVPYDKRLGLAKLVALLPV
jgi:hypothetical protein